MLPSPRGRAYRTISKRKAFSGLGGTRLGLIDPEQVSAQGRVEIHRCAIEPPQHAAIYAYLQSTLQKPHAGPLAEGLRHVIIKGSYDEFILVLTVSEINPSIVKSTNTISKGLTRLQKDVVAVFLYEDRSRGGYYLGMTDPESPGRLRKIFGKQQAYHRVAGRGFLVPPLAFSQINHSQLETLSRVARQLLSPGSDEVLYDFYCGYGFFALMLADGYRKVTGIEVSADAVDAANENAQRLGISHVRFHRVNLTAQGIHTVMRDTARHTSVLLDPPRNGTAPGVIEAIAEKKPERIVHIFCNIELIGEELQRWGASGYSPVSAIPVDMFPGTAAMEVLVLLRPKF